MLKHILPLIPRHRIYTEAFCGGAAVLFAKRPAEAEVINDINMELTNFYWCAQVYYSDLKREIDKTLHSRDVHAHAGHINAYPQFFAPAERAWAVWALCKMSFASMMDGTFGYDFSGTMTKKLRNAKDEQSVLLTVTNPWQGADGIAVQLFIARDGETAPEGFDGQVLEGDADRIVAMSSTHIAMLDAIGEVDRVVGVSGIDYISNPDIQARRDRIGDVGYEGNINYELLLSLDPDLVLLYGVNGASGMEPKLRELGIPFMYIGDYLEESPLGKAEWMVALSEVVGCRSEGEKVFAEIPVRYNALKQRVAENALDAPSVMLNMPYGDSWFMPSAGSYAVRLIEDAGGDYIYKKNTGNASTPVDMEEAYLLASAADLWLNVGMANTLDE